MNAEARPIPSFSLHRDAWGQLVLTDAGGRQTVGVENARAFPISSPEGFIFICDAEGRELMCLEDLSALPADLRAVIEDELAQREFMPVVVGIDKVLAETHPSEWHVETDRGRTTFLMEDSDVDVRRLGPNRLLLVDAHGVRYLIPDVRKLDAPSRRILDRYL